MLDMDRATRPARMGVTQMNAKQILQRTVNKAIANGAPVIVEKPTIYVALSRKLGREPSHRELVADVKRILSEVRV
jgi:hypothetical protein